MKYYPIRDQLNRQEVKEILGRVSFFAIAMAETLAIMSNMRCNETTFMKHSFIIPSHPTPSLHLSPLTTST